MALSRSDLKPARQQLQPPPMARPDQPLLILRFRRRRPFGAARDTGAAAARPDRLRGGQCGLPLWHEDQRRDRGARPGFARPAGRTLRPGPDRHRLQHRLDDRARSGARRAQPADRRHRPRDQAGGRACRRPARSACSAPTPPSCSPMSTGSRRSSPPTAWSFATARPSWSISPRRSCAARPTAPEAYARILDGLLTRPGGEQVDTIVLACTHFPLVEAELAAAAPRPLTFVAWRRGDRPPHRVAAPRPRLAGRGRPGRCTSSPRLRRWSRPIGPRLPDYRR